MSEIPDRAQEFEGRQLRRPPPAEAIEAPSMAEVGEVLALAQARIATLEQLVRTLRPTVRSRKLRRQLDRAMGDRLFGDKS